MRWRQQRGGDFAAIGVSEADVSCDGVTGGYVSHRWGANRRCPPKIHGDKIREKFTRLSRRQKFPSLMVISPIPPSRTDPDDDVVDVTSFSALDVVEIKSLAPSLQAAPVSARQRLCDGVT